MSIFDLYHAEPEAVERTLSTLRSERPGARLEARVQDRMVVVRGEVDSLEERREIISRLKDIDRDFVVVVSGALRVRESGNRTDADASSRSTGGRGRAAMTSRTRATKRIYRVQPGDTLERIAERFYGDPGGALLLAATNGDSLEDVPDLPPGWILEVPEAFPYTARSNDTLEAVARRFFGDAGAAGIIARSNPEAFRAGNVLSTGTELQIPLRANRSALDTALP